MQKMMLKNSRPISISTQYRDFLTFFTNTIKNFKTNTATYANAIGIKQCIGNS